MDHLPRESSQTNRTQRSPETPLPSARGTERPASPNWWPACPDCNPQRLLEIIGYRVKGPDFIQALVLLTHEDNGVCQAPFVEHTDRVEVRAIACCQSALGYGPIENQTTTAWPSNVLLDSPLEDRIVVDVDSGRPLRRFTLGRPNGSPGSVSLFIPVVGEVAWVPVDEL